MGVIVWQLNVVFFFLFSLLVKPISTGLPTMSSDVNGEHDMDRKPVLPLRLEVDALSLLGYNSSS